MAKDSCFDYQYTINSDEDDKQIDSLSFPTTFFLSNETSTLAIANSESANQPISSPQYKFMGKNYCSEFQELNNQMRIFKDQKIVQLDRNQKIIKSKQYSFLLPQKNHAIQQNHKFQLNKQHNFDQLIQRNNQEKLDISIKNGKSQSMSPISKDQIEQKLVAYKLNGILKGSCLISSPNKSTQFRPISDSFTGRPSNKNVSFQFTLEQIKLMRKNNKSNIFSVSNHKYTKLFLVENK